MSALFARLIGIKAGAPSGGGAAAFSETWTGTTGSAWPAQWSTVAVGGAAGYSATIQANTGQMIPGTVGYGGIREYAASAKTGDFDLTVTFTAANQGEAYDAIVTNTDGSVNSGNSFYPNNGYHLEIGNNSTPTACYLKLLKYSAGTSTTLVNNVTKTITAGTAYRIHYQRTGTTLQFRMWQLGNSEPSTWDGTATDSSMLTYGGLHLAAGNGSAGTAMTVNWDDLTVN